MPDLSSTGVYNFWRQYPDPQVYKILIYMENVESWVLDGDPEVEIALQKLGTLLDNIGAVDLQEESQLIQLANSLKMSRMLRLLQALDIAYPGAATKLIEFAKEHTKTNDDSFGLFLHRNLTFEKLRILSRVLDSERLTKISQILEQ